jgi:hypothetical protein
MELVHQIVGTEGLQIPLPVIQRYGLRPGARVVLELRADTIQILPALLGQEEIENRALRYLIVRLGDAATVKAERENDEWRVAVYGAGMSDPVGWLVYASTGEFHPERSTTVEEMCQRVEGKTSRS